MISDLQFSVKKYNSNHAIVYRPMYCIPLGTYISGLASPVLMCTHRNHSVEIPWLELIYHNHTLG